MTEDRLAASDREFERILRDRDLRIMFQPIVHLRTGAVVGYEALVRGPDGSPLASPGQLLSAANRAGRLVEFDWAARATACREALDAHLDADQLLFLNVEPIALDSECPTDLWADIERGLQTFRVVLEVTERSLDRDPGTLLDGIERQRRVVAGIALDDVGSGLATLAMLPLVAPTVIKIDRHVVQGAIVETVARVVDAVQEEAERTGAVILAEGVETVGHKHNAAAYGAQLGQGHLLGAPQRLPRDGQSPAHLVEMPNTEPMIIATPFDALATKAYDRAGADLLHALTRNLESQAEACSPSLFVSLLPDQLAQDPAEQARLVRIAAEGTFTAALGTGIPSEPGDGVRGIGQGRGPHPHDEWAAVALGPCVNSAVLARRTAGADGPWMYGITHDRRRAIAAARSMVRLLGAPEPSYRFDEWDPNAI